MKERLQLETERMVLKEIQESDGELIVSWRSDPEIYQYFTSPHKVTLQEHLNWYRDCYLQQENRHDFVAWGRSDGCPIGVFGIKLLGEHLAEISYLVAPDWQHMGLAKEAVSGLEGFVKDRMEIDRTCAVVHEENRASISFLQALGYQAEETDPPFVTYTKTLL